MTLRLMKNKHILNRAATAAVMVLLMWPAKSAACTSFIVSGKVTPDGRPLIFKNRDTGAWDNVAVLVQGERYRYIGIVGAKDLRPNEVWGGHNEAGFAIMNTAAYNLNGCKSEDADNDGVVMRRALEVCSTLQDFENLLDTLPKPLGVNSNYGVLDAQGGCAYYETGDNGFIKFDANNPQDAPDGYIVRTNHGLSGCRDIDQGVERYMAISDFMAQACRGKNLECQYLLTQVPRHLTHGLTKINLYDLMPRDEQDTKLFPFIDFIPRFITASMIMVQGVQEGEEPSNTISWTSIGWPVASVAIPLMIQGNAELPKVVARGEDGRAWLSVRAMEQRLHVFCLRRGNKREYIDIARLINQKGTGIAQRIVPIEAQVLKRGNAVIKKVRRGKAQGAEQRLREYYAWVDEYLMKEYPTANN